MAHSQAKANHRSLSFHLLTNPTPLELTSSIFPFLAKHYSSSTLDDIQQLFQRTTSSSSSSQNDNDVVILRLSFSVSDETCGLLLCEVRPPSHQGDRLARITNVVIHSHHRQCGRGVLLLQRLMQNILTKKPYNVTVVVAPLHGTTPRATRRMLTAAGFERSPTFDFVRYLGARPVSSSLSLSSASASAAAASFSSSSSTIVSRIKSSSPSSRRVEPSPLRQKSDAVSEEAQSLTPAVSPHLPTAKHLSSHAGERPSHHSHHPQRRKEQDITNERSNNCTAVELIREKVMEDMLFDKSKNVRSGGVRIDFVDKNVKEYDWDNSFKLLPNELFLNSYSNSLTIEQRSYQTTLRKHQPPKTYRHPFKHFTTPWNRPHTKEQQQTQQEDEEKEKEKEMSTNDGDEEEEKDDERKKKKKKKKVPLLKKGKEGKKRKEGKKEKELTVPELRHQYDLNMKAINKQRQNKQRQNKRTTKTKTNKTTSSKTRIKQRKKDKEEEEEEEEEEMMSTTVGKSGMPSSTELLDFYLLHNKHLTETHSTQKEQNKQKEQNILSKNVQLSNVVLKKDSYDMDTQTVSLSEQMPVKYETMESTLKNVKIHLKDMKMEKKVMEYVSDYDQFSFEMEKKKIDESEILLTQEIEQLTFDQHRLNVERMKMRKERVEQRRRRREKKMNLNDGRIALRKRKEEALKLITEQQEQFYST